MWIDCYLLIYLVLFKLVSGLSNANKRQKRYLLFTKDTQWGVFATVSIPLHPETTTSVAWFYEANYYNVDNSTYFQPLLGDIPWGRSRDKRSTSEGTNELLTRSFLYTTIEALLRNLNRVDVITDVVKGLWFHLLLLLQATLCIILNKYPGRECLLRAICEAATVNLTHNGVLGDLLYLTLTPSTSIEEATLEDCFYEAEYRGILHDCAKYEQGCPTNPLDYISVLMEQL